jgi:hypothetical protein
MANREKGEIGLTINGKSYTFVMNTNALVKLQAVLTEKGQPIATMEAIYAALHQQSVAHMRAFFWAGLQKYHPDVTVESAGDLMDDAGGFFGVTDLINEAKRASDPDPADVAELSEGANPPKARARKSKRGTGDVFKSMRAKSA